MANTFCKEAVVHIAVYILNRAKIRVNHDKTPYELWKGRPASVKYFRIFGSTCYIRRDGDDLSKFEARADEGIFLGCSSKKYIYRCYNKRLHKIVESTNVKIDEVFEKIKENVEIPSTCQEEEDPKHEEDEEEIEQTPLMTPAKTPLKTPAKTPSKFVQRNHPED